MVCFFLLSFAPHVLSTNYRGSQGPRYGSGTYCPPNPVHPYKDLRSEHRFGIPGTHPRQPLPHVVPHSQRALLLQIDDIIASTSRGSTGIVPPDVPPLESPTATIPSPVLSNTEGKSTSLMM